MTIDKARQILEKYTKGKTDEEVEKIIAQQSRICDVYLSVFERYLTSYKRKDNNCVRP